MAAVFLVYSFGALSRSAQAQVPSGRDVVSPVVRVSKDRVAPGDSFQILVVATIRPGFHVNAHKKSADYLIETDLRAQPPEGLKAGEVRYPDGTLRKFAFSKISLNVYEGTITLRMPVTALTNASAGARRIPLKLRYQACSNEICLPPVTLDIEAKIDVQESK
ncbi:MAG: hypothetical protein NVS9B4_27800 [Candidatus Acidiferrum sp.]